jgi:two-component system, OmpR family, response regulator QseB
MRLARPWWEKRGAAMNTTNLNLSPRERAILEALLERPGRPISRRQLRERLYGAREPEVLGNPVEVHIHNLRAKLGEGVIRTIRGLGYFIVSEQP